MAYAYECSKCAAPYIPDPKTDEEWIQNYDIACWICPGCSRASWRDAKKEFNSVTNNGWCSDKVLLREAKRQAKVEYWTSLKTGPYIQAAVDDMDIELNDL